MSENETVEAEVATEVTAEEVSVPEVQEETVVAEAVVAEPVVEYVAEEINIKSLLEAGAHYGHKVEKWNPRMMPYIFTQRNRVHIINLDKTVDLWGRARKFVVDITSRGGNILFVGTKLQAVDLVKESAIRSESFYVNKRWLGGTLSNFQTIKKSIHKMKKMEELIQAAEDEKSDVKLAKKEKLRITRYLEKLEGNIGGIREMKQLPDALFIIDIRKESIAVAEAYKLNIPVIALVDTNTDPARVKFPVPSNDDASGAIKLFVNGVADAVLEGHEAYKLRMQDTGRKDGDVVDTRAKKTKRTYKTGRPQA